MKILAPLRRHIPIILYLLFYLIIIGNKLITQPTPFYDWDESIYAEVGREMINEKTVMPLWQYEIWLDKPPLVPLFYGVVQAVTPWINPEISIRVATLLMSIVLLGMVYTLYYKVVKDVFLPTLVIIITSVSPIFLQRSQVANIDLFLLIGWTGYILFYKSYWLSFLFLAISVMSKSLIGFYPAGIMLLFHGYQWYTKQIKTRELKKELKKITSQIGILSIYYIVMLAMYGQPFWHQHIIESHTKRVTASIESHFGKRTYYIDILFEQFGIYTLFAGLGILALVWNWYKKIITNTQVLYATFLIPWFLFLNLTKTKIFWYGYPYIPQFVFLMLYPLTLATKWLPKWIYYAALTVIAIAVINAAFVKQKVHTQQFSQKEDHHRVAEYAADRCEMLYVLVEPQGREASATLASMDLLITTSRWWGNHPSMVFYFGKKIEYIYELDRFASVLKNPGTDNCLVINKEDVVRMSGKKPAKEFGTLNFYTFN